MKIIISEDVLNKIIHDSTRISSELIRMNLKELALEVSKIREDLLSSLQEE